MIATSQNQIVPIPLSSLRRQNHYGDEDGPETHHHVIAVVKQRNLVRPFRLRKIGQALDVRPPLPVSQKAQHLGHFQWVVEFSFFHIRLSENRQRRSFLRFKESFHRRQRRLLIIGNQRWRRWKDSLNRRKER